MKIHDFTPVTSQQAAVFLETRQYEICVLHIMSCDGYVISLKKVDTGDMTHAISYKQRSLEGRKPEVKMFKSFPLKDLIKLDYLNTSFKIIE